MPATNQDPGGCNCGPPADCLPCNPCCIPKADLAVTEIYPGIGFPGTHAIVWDAVTSTWGGAGGSIGDPFPFTYSVSCPGGNMLLAVEDSLFNPVPVTLADFVCSPFHLHYTVAGYGDFYIDE